MVLTRRNLITLRLACTLFVFASVSGIASVVSDPQYYVLAVVVEVQPGDTIVVGVIHGSTMGESEPVSWVMFAQPYLEDGTPIGIN